jgi:hypothetical protein
MDVLKNGEHKFKNHFYKFQIFLFATGWFGKSFPEIFLKH